MAMDSLKVAQVSVRNLLGPRRSWRLFIFWCVAVTVIWVLAFRVADSPPLINNGHPSPSTALQAMATWDGTAYQAITQRGYSTSGDDPRFFSFFPLYPGLARLLGGAGYAVLAGVILSQLLALASILLMSGLVHGSEPAPLIREPGFWMMISPFGFFFFVFYTESLFLFLSLVHYTAFRAGRSRISFAAGFLAGLTRPTAIVLPALVGFEAFRRMRKGEEWKTALVCAAAPALAIACYAIVFVGWKMGHVSGYMQISHRYWLQSFTVPFSGYLQALVSTIEKARYGFFAVLGDFIKVFSTAAVLAILIAGRKKLEPALIAYTVAALLLVHAVSPIKSSGRYEVVLFPVFFALATGAVPRMRATWAAVPVLAYLSATMFMHFAEWDWVA